MSVRDKPGELHRSHSVLDSVLDIRGWESSAFSTPPRMSIVIELGPLLHEILFIFLAIIGFCILLRTFDNGIHDTNNGHPRRPRQERGRSRQGRYQAQSHQSRKHITIILPVLGILFLIYLWLFKQLSGPYLTGLTHNVWALQESGGSAAFWANLFGDLIIWLRVCDLSRWNKILTTFAVRALVAITRPIGRSPLTISNGELSLSEVAGNSTGVALLDNANFGVAGASLTTFTNVVSIASIATKLWYFPRALKKFIEVGSRASRLELKKMVLVLVEFGLGSYLIRLATSSMLGTSQTA